MKWLILSHGFNMDSRAASLTITDKIPYFMNAGIKPIVLSAITGTQDTRFPHIQLFPWGPSGFKFDMRHWLSNKIKKGIVYKIIFFFLSVVLFPFILIEKLIFGLSSQSSWALPAAYKGLRILSKNDVPVVFSTGGSWSAHYAAWLIKKNRPTVKWIAEIHDPMVCREGGASTRESRFVEKLEGLICRDADHIYWFAEEALKYAKHRHPNLGAKGFTVQPGSEPPGCYDVQIPLTHTYNDTSRINVCYFGAVGYNSLGPLLTAIEELKLNDDMNLIFYGTDFDKKSQQALTGQKALTGLSVKCMQRLSRAESYQKMCQADVLLLLHGDGKRCEECIPSKIYDYYWTNRPILALTKLTPSFDQDLIERGAYVGNIDEPETIRLALKELVSDWRAGQLRTTLYQPISPKNAVDKILKVFKTKDV